MVLYFMQVTRLSNTAVNKINAKTAVGKIQVGFKEPHRTKLPEDNDKRR